jgi:hypothetical protein
VELTDSILTFCSTFVKIKSAIILRF